MQVAYRIPAVRLVNGDGRFESTGALTSQNASGPVKHLSYISCSFGASSLLRSCI